MAQNEHNERLVLSALEQGENNIYYIRRITRIDVHDLGETLVDLYNKEVIDFIPGNSRNRSERWFIK